MIASLISSASALRSAREQEPPSFPLGSDVSDGAVVLIAARADLAVCEREIAEYEIHLARTMDALAATRAAADRARTLLDHLEAGVRAVRP